MYRKNYYEGSRQSGILQSFYQGDIFLTPTSYNLRWSVPGHSLVHTDFVAVVVLGGLALVEFVILLNGPEVSIPSGDTIK